MVWVQKSRSLLRIDFSLAPLSARLWGWLVGHPGAEDNPAADRVAGKPAGAAEKAESHPAFAETLTSLRKADRGSPCTGIQPTTSPRLSRPSALSQLHVCLFHICARKLACLHEISLRRG